ncbi:FAD:protein FMN transferase, partial [bacterium]|nr:FAD:protein FMN transferase [bacterium]
MRATRRGLGAASLLAVLFALILTACKNAAPAATDPDSKFCVRKFSGEAIGTWWHVTALEAEPKALTGEKLEAAIVDAIAEVDRLMSTYREDSEVVAINRAPAGAWVNVSPSTSEVIALAIETASLTGGAFDPTVAPIVDALGFGPESKLTPEQVKTIPIGIAHLTLDAPNRRVKKDDGAVMIDLSAIAKGYAVDRVVDALAALGIENMMVEIGGEVRV